MSDLTAKHQRINRAANIVHKAKRLVTITVVGDNHVEAHEGGTLDAMLKLAVNEVLCVVRPGIPVSHAKAMIYFQLLERERMGKGTI